jgi:hypothetical protein
LFDPATVAINGAVVIPREIDSLRSAQIPIAVAAREADCGRGLGADRPESRGVWRSSDEGSEPMSNTQSDRSRVAASDPSEVRYFGKKHGLTDEQVLDLIKRHGNDRKTLEAAVANAPTS